MYCQHLERELVCAEESGSQTWAKRLRELFQTMCHHRNDLQAEGYPSFPEAEVSECLARYAALVAQGIEANPILERQTGRTARDKIRSLLDRLADFKEDILRFAHDWQVPYTNNVPEQAIRFAKGQGKEFRMLSS